MSDTTQDYQPADRFRSESLVNDEVERIGELHAESVRRTEGGEVEVDVRNDIERRLIEEGNPWTDIWTHAAANGHTRRDAKYRVMLDWFNDWVERLKGDERFGQFSELQPLGAGGFGAVFRAHDNKRGGPVAIKVPHVSERQFPSD